MVDGEPETEAQRQALHLGLAAMSAERGMGVYNTEREVESLGRACGTACWSAGVTCQQAWDMLRYCGDAPMAWNYIVDGWHDADDAAETVRARVRGGAARMVEAS